MIIFCLSKHQIMWVKTKQVKEEDGNNSEIRDYFELRKHAIKTK